MSRSISVEVWSDVACPWCFLGQRSFDEAVRGFADAAAVEVTYRSFQLDPDAPESTPLSERESLQQRKGLTAEQIDGAFATITERGREVGLAYDFDSVRGANTRRAHRLIHFAAGHGIQREAVDALFSAHFERGELVSDPDTLVDIASALGLDPVEARAAIDSAELDAEVAADIAQANQFGISGVPFFVIDRKYGVSGAQPVEAFTQILEQVWQEKEDEHA